jgi:hypothetical protein
MNPIQKRILSNIIEEAGPLESPCWLWQGYRMWKGYGHIQIKGSPKRVHRIAYEVFVDSIPKKLLVLHRCDNPACCNPQHLFVGTQKQNIADSLSKKRFSVGPKNGMFGRKGPTHPCYNNGKPKRLTVEKVRSIFSLYRQGRMQKDIAKSFGISRQTVGDIVNGRIWRPIFQEMQNVA